MKRRGDFPGIAVVDYFLALIVIFVVLFTVSSASMNIDKANAEKQIPNPTLFVIVVDWDGNLDDDVDTYVADPADHLVSYRRIQDGLMTLERDDTGVRSNTAISPGGEKIVAPYNEERVDIRGVIPGEYIVNVHMYRKASPQPVKVNITLYGLKGANMKVIEQAVELSDNGDEKTAFRFTLSKDGQVIDTNHLPKKLTTSISTMSGQ